MTCLKTAKADDWKVYLRFIYNISMNKSGEKTEQEASTSDKLKKEMLKPVTRTDSELDEELKELEVENSAGGKDGGGG